jgi:hypothetical protein
MRLIIHILENQLAPVGTIHHTCRAVVSAKADGKSNRDIPLELERLSFKGAVDALRQYTSVLAQARTNRQKWKLWQHLLGTLTCDLVPRRPGRTKPRALKRAQNRSPYSTGHDENSSNSRIATAVGTAAPSNFKALSNRHSEPTRLWPLPSSPLQIMNSKRKTLAFE